MLARNKEYEAAELEAFTLNYAMLHTPHGRELFAFADAFQIASGLFGYGRIPVACGEHPEIYARVLRAFHADDWIVSQSSVIPTIGYVQLNRS